MASSRSWSGRGGSRLGSSCEYKNEDDDEMKEVGDEAAETVSSSHVREFCRHILAELLYIVPHSDVSLSEGRWLFSSLEGRGFGGGRLHQAKGCLEMIDWMGMDMKMAVLGSRVRELLVP